MSAGRPMWLFNLGRQDLPHVVLMCALCASVALILRSGQGPHPEGKTVWRDLLIIVGTLGSLVLCVLALIKLVYSCVREPLGSSSGYTELEDGQGGGSAVRGGAAQSQARPAQAHQAQPQAAARSAGGEAAAAVAPAASSRSQRSSYRSREEEDIECGLLLEASAVEFEYNGVRHQKGSLRVIKVERDGVCERQGACAVGDVLVAVDGQPVTDMHPNKVKALMRGKAGTSIILGLYTDQSREIINRHVVLAPSPMSITLSPRDFGRHSGQRASRS